MKRRWGPRAFRLCSRVFVAVYGCFPLFGDLRSSVVVIRRGDRYLLQRRSDGLGWAFPGGISWFWETEVQTAVREVEEETGLRVRSPRLLFTYRDRYYVRSRIAVFAAEAEGVPRGSWEGEPAWMPLDSTRSGIFAPQRAILDFLDRRG